MNLSDKHISVCVCTYKRPEMLARNLKGIFAQERSAFSVEIIVIDNDILRTAEKVVQQFQQNSDFRVIYECLPEKSISLARNKAVEMASGNLIAFLDDDEWPDEDWLIHLCQAIDTYHSDGVLGPVIPYFPKDAPGWIRTADVFDRRRFRTGTELTSRDTRTGNVLMTRDSLPEDECIFNPDFGLTGGEDIDFFTRQINSGRNYIWCDEATVYEMVPQERWTSEFHFRKYFRIGALNGERLRNDGIRGIIYLLKSIISAFVWILATMVLLPFGKANWIKPALKMTYSVACFLAYCGFSFEKYRG